MPVEHHTLLLFVPACFAMNLTIGPNNLMVMSNGARHGPRAAGIAVLGRLCGQAILITISAAGLSALLLGSAFAFNVVKTIGALWLLVIAWRLWRSADATVPSGTERDVAAPLSRAVDGRLIRSLARDEFLVSLGNPKAILIFTAFLPQFVDPSRPVAAQFMVIGTLFLALEWVAAVGYGVLGARLSAWLRTARNRLLFQRGNAALLALAAVGLLLMRQDPPEVPAALAPAR